MGFESIPTECLGTYLVAGLFMFVAGMFAGWVLACMRTRPDWEIRNEVHREYITNEKSDAGSGERSVDHAEAISQWHEAVLHMGVGNVFRSRWHGIEAQDRRIAS